MIGVGIPPEYQRQLSPEQVLGRLPFSWWYDWTALHLGAEGYVPMLRNPVPDSPAWLQALADALWPGHTWLLWNEPHDPNQGWVEPEQAAEASRRWAMHDLHWVGPNLRVGAAGLAWYTAYKRAGGVCPSAHGIHIYANGPNHWQDQYNEFVRWCERERWVRPVWVTEMSAGHFAPDIQLALATHMAERKPALVERWAWFSSLYGPSAWQFGGGDLFAWERAEGDDLRVTGALSPLGREMRRLLLLKQTFLPLVGR